MFFLKVRLTQLPALVRINSAFPCEFVYPYGKSSSYNISILIEKHMFWVYPPETNIFSYFYIRARASLKKVQGSICRVSEPLTIRFRSCHANTYTIATPLCTFLTTCNRLFIQLFNFYFFFYNLEVFIRKIL